MADSERMGYGNITIICTASSYGFDPINNKILFKNEDNLKKMITEERIFATGFELDDRIIKKLNGYA